MACRPVARAGPGQPVGLRDRQLVKQLVAVFAALQPVASGVLPITGRLPPISRRPSSTLRRGGTIRRGSLAVPRGARQNLRALTSRASVRRQLEISQLSSPIARGPDQVA